MQFFWSLLVALKFACVLGNPLQVPASRTGATIETIESSGDDPQDLDVAQEIGLAAAATVEKVVNKTPESTENARVVNEISESTEDEMPQMVVSENALYGKLLEVETMLKKQDEKLDNTGTSLRKQSRMLSVIADTVCNKDCSDLYRCGQRKSGVYDISPTDSPDLKKVHCEFDKEGGWTYLLRRSEGDTLFNRTWDEYKSGFGNPDSSYWLGLEYMYLITQQGDYSVQFEFDHDGDRYVARYTNFGVGPEDNEYRLTDPGTMSQGNSSDVLHQLKDVAFSTYDQDNDNSEARNMADVYGRKGGWWYNPLVITFTAGYGCEGKDCARWNNKFGLTNMVVKITKVG